MQTTINQNHWTDAESGAPSGGSTYGNGFAISWQNGALGRGDERKNPNGAFVEDVIKAAAGRLEYYQQGKFNCVSNEIALAHLNEALKALAFRTQERENRQVEGTHSI